MALSYVWEEGLSTEEADDWRTTFVVAQSILSL